MSKPVKLELSTEADCGVDDIKNPKYKGVFDAYRRTWAETFDPTKSLSWNSLARVKNFWRVSDIRPRSG